MHPLVGVVLAYLLGSIPAAFIAGKLTRGIDLREHGSGNLGATNAYRVLGGKIASVVMAFDAAKGAVPVLLFPDWTTRTYSGFWHPEFWPLAFGIAAIIGHVRPIFLLWKGGGKGVATASGVFLALAPVSTILAFVAWLAVILRTGYVSLASLVAALILPVAVGITSGMQSPLFVVAVGVSIFVFWSHRANIGRLRRGEEHRFGGKKTAESSPPSKGWDEPVNRHDANPDPGSSRP